MSERTRIRGLVLCLALWGLCSGAVWSQSTVAVEGPAGPDWHHTHWFFVVPLDLTPQYAVWVEDSSGRPLATLAVTSKSARGGWVDAPAGGRPEALPVWRHRTGSLAPSGGPGASGVDAVAAASRGEGLSAAGRLPAGAPAQGGRVLVEINSSYDYDGIWREGLPPSDPHFCGVNGRPSAVWAADLPPGPGAQLLVFRPLGYGSATGADGGIRPFGQDLPGPPAFLAGLTGSWTP